ncbi:MAG: FIST C-terminal domain-containing protein [Hadesarchaea archaeon]|nr:FIST C-terminal domain-containing protein [Hadesarchaea archaeon]
MRSTGVGASQLKDSFAAGKEAASQAIKATAGRPVGLCLVFSSSKYNPKRLLEGVKSVLGPVPIAGCTTAGEITPAGPLEGSVAVMVISADVARAGIGLGKGVRKKPKEAGREAISSAIRDLGYPTLCLTAPSLEAKLPGYVPFFVLMFPDGLSGKEEDIIEGMREALGGYFPIVGGSAGDDLKLKRTYQFCTEGAFTDAVVCALVATNNPVGFGSKHGWRPLDRLALVTKSSGRVVKELNHRPAAEVYAEMLKVSLEDLQKEVLAWRKGLSNPLGMPDLLGEIWLRHPQALLKDGSISFFSKVPEGVALRLMYGRKEDLVKAARDAALEAMEGCGKPREVEAAIVFNCVARYKFLGQEGAREELRELKRVLGDAPLVGFYTYGEQGFTPGGMVGHRNQTITMCLIGRR